MMFKTLSVSTIICIILSTNTVFAMECEVKFRAKKADTEKHWFGSVPRIKTRSGTTIGEGRNKSKCEIHALKKIIKEGWEITYHKIISSK